MVLNKIIFQNTLMPRETPPLPSWHMSFLISIFKPFPYCSCKRHWNKAGNGFPRPGCNHPSLPFLATSDESKKRWLFFIKIKYVCLKRFVLAGSKWHNHQAKVQLTTIKTFCWTNWITKDILLNVIPALFCFVVQSVLNISFVDAS